MNIGRAIATAVNTVKRWCEGGTVSKTGGPEGGHGVTAATKAKACKAVAQWEAKKRASSLKASQDRADEPWDEADQEVYEFFLDEELEVLGCNCP